MNVKSTLLMVIFGALVSSVAVAKEAKDPAAFQAAKEQRVANLQERLQIVQTHITCAQAAQDHDAMKACHAAAKQQGDALEAKIKAQHPGKNAKPNQ